MAKISRLEDMVAVITGGAKGIGRAIAERFVAEGAKVVIADIDDEKGQAVAETPGGEGRIAYTHCDITEKLDIHNLVATTVDRFGSVDILVNNAAMVIASDFLDVEEADFDRVLCVNLKGSFLCSQAVARKMVEKVKEGGKPGNIINITSVNTFFALADQVPYSVSKGGLTQLTKVMALSLAPYGIRANAIAPGSIMTEILGKVVSDREAMDRVLSRTPLSRVGNPEEIASIAAFLASDDASYVTGETIFADGGRLALNYTVPVVR